MENITISKDKLESQEGAFQSENCKWFKVTLLKSLDEEINPLVLEAVRYSRHPTLEDKILELSRSELVFIALLQALSSKNTVMSGRLIQEAQDWLLLPRISAYFGGKLMVEFDCTDEFVGGAAEFAHVLADSGLIKVPRIMLKYLDELAGMVRDDVSRRKRPEQGQADNSLEPQNSAQEECQNNDTRRRKATANRRKGALSTESLQQDECRQQTAGVQMKSQETQTMDIPLPLSSSSPSSQQIQRDRADIERATSSLRIAVRKNDPAATRAALDQGADLDCSNSDGRTQLHLAVSWGKMGVIKELLRAGADLEKGDIDGETPLHRAARKGNVPVIDELLMAGADLEAKSNYNNTPLHLAALEGNDEAVVKLIQAGADLHALGYLGKTPLEKAAVNNRKQTELTLRSLGAMR